MRRDVTLGADSRMVTSATDFYPVDENYNTRIRPAVGRDRLKCPFQMKKSLPVFILARSAFVGAGALLVLSQFVSDGVHAWLSSLPLALAGLGYILLQIDLKPSRQTLWKRLLLA